MCVWMDAVAAHQAVHTCTTLQMRAAKFQVNLAGAHDVFAELKARISDLGTIFRSQRAQDKTKKLKRHSAPNAMSPMNSLNTDKENQEVFTSLGSFCSTRNTHRAGERQNKFFREQTQLSQPLR